MQTSLDILCSSRPANLTSEADAQSSSSSQDTVGTRASTALVKVPSWFTVGAAARVAQLKGVEHLLVLDRGGLVGTAGRTALAGAPASDPLARWMTATSATLDAGASLEDAARSMDRLGADCLPVTIGPLLVGLVTRDDLCTESARAAG
jgi:CBS domain-containing protein